MFSPASCQPGDQLKMLPFTLGMCIMKIKQAYKRSDFGAEFTVEEQKRGPALFWDKKPGDPGLEDSNNDS